MDVIIFLSIWWSLGLIGYFLVRYWWLDTNDWTTSERSLGVFQAVLFGPFLIVIGIILCAPLILRGPEERVLITKRKR